jgi:hypothetical protein
MDWRNDMRYMRASKTVMGVLLTVVLLAAFQVMVGRAQAAEFDCSAQSSIPLDQCEALVAIFQNTGGEDWNNHSGWLENGDPCQWYGVSCSGGNVVALDLYSNNLTGALPLEIGGFPALKTLTINGNPLSGPIPLTITFMDLDLFHFHNTSLCEPADPNFQDWFLQIVYRLSSGIYCSALQPSSTPSPNQTQADLPWPQQTLTALADENNSVLGAATLEPTPTKYYTLETPTLTLTPTTPAVSDGSDSGSADSEQDSQPFQGLSNLLSNIPSGWLLVLTIPLVLIVIGVLLEMRDRRKEREERKTSKLEWGDVEEPK